MTATGFDHLERELRAGVRQHRRSTRRSWRRSTVVLVAVSLLIFAGVAAAATSLWQPQLGDSKGGGHPSASPAAPPTEQLDKLEVLRREQTDQDRGADSRYALRFFGARSLRNPLPEPDKAITEVRRSGIRTNYVRLLKAGDSDPGTVLVPVVESNGIRDALCLFVRDLDGGGQKCFSTADVLAGAAVLGIGKPAPGTKLIPDPDRPGIGHVSTPPDIVLSGLVPDGVARVRSAEVTANVHDNYFHLRRRAGTANARIQWLDKDGSPVAQKTSG